jgi:Transcriptional regulator, contains sigma factor-related N-terminal domain
MKPAPTPAERDDSLALRAAWLHYVGGLTQAEVAKRLGLPSVKTHRMIARMVRKVRLKSRLMAISWLALRLRTNYVKSMD